MRFLLRASALMLCLLFAPSAYGQDFTHTIEFATDTEEAHFEDYWRRANDALLTAEGRTRLESGQTRLSLRAMSNPVRYGLVAADKAREALTAADLLCDNRDSGSLQLRCRMPGASHSRRVRLTEASCAGHPDLFTLIPDGCEHPYVMTVEGRQVTLTRLTLPAPPSAPIAVAHVPPADIATTPQVIAEQRAEIDHLRSLVHDLDADREELRRDRRTVDRQLSRGYLALLLLVVVVIAATVIIWRQHDKLKDSLVTQNSLAEQVQGLSETSARFSLTNLRAGDTQRRLAAFAKGVHTEASSVVGALLERNRALEEELLTHKSRPSIIIDESAFKAEEIAADAEARARQSVHELRGVQDIERQRLQDRIDELLQLTEELREDAARERQRHRTQTAVYEKHQAVTAKNYRDLEQCLSESEGRLRDAEEKMNEYAATNTRLAGDRAGIDEQNRQLRLANHTLKHLLLRARQHLEGLGLDAPDFLVVSPTDRLFIPTPPNTRSVPPPSHPPSNPPTEVTTAVIGVPLVQPLAGPPGAMTTSRHTLTGIGDESPERSPPRDTLRLAAEAGSPSPTLQPENPHHAPTTPPPPNYFGVETAPLDRWDIPPSLSEPRDDRELHDRHAPLTTDTGDVTGLWMMSRDEHGSGDQAISLVPIPAPARVPIIPEERPPDSSERPPPDQDRTDPQRLMESIFHAPTRETSLIATERIIAQTNGPQKS